MNTANAPHPTRDKIRELPPLNCEPPRPSPVKLVLPTECLEPMPLDPRYLPFHLDPRRGFLPLAGSRPGRR